MTTPAIFMCEDAFESIIWVKLYCCLADYKKNKYWQNESKFNWEKIAQSIK